MVVSAVHGLMPALLTVIRLLVLGSASGSGSVMPPEYWLKFGRPIEVYQDARAMRFVLTLKLALMLGNQRRYSFSARAPRGTSVSCEYASEFVFATIGSGRPLAPRIKVPSGRR